nr:hypothetical protein [Croceicoccus pelagius]
MPGIVGPEFIGVIREQRSDLHRYAARQTIERDFGKTLARFAPSGQGIDLVDLAQRDTAMPAASADAHEPVAIAR